MEGASDPTLCLLKSSQANRPVFGLGRFSETTNGLKMWLGLLWV
jgi:hypothetical protein